MIDRVSDEAVAACVAPALRVIYDGGDWGRLVTAQLIALIEYTSRREPDRRADRKRTLIAALHDLGGNPLVPDDGGPEERAAGALAAAVGRTDDSAEAVRRVLRPVLVAELDDELTSTMVLMDGFRGRVRDA